MREIKIRKFGRGIVLPELFFLAVVIKRLPVRSARRGGSESVLVPMPAGWPRASAQLSCSAFGGNF